MKYIFVVVVTLFLCIANSLFAETVQISAQKDNTLYFSQSGSLSNGSGSYIFVGDTAARNGSSERRAVIAFDIASIIPDGATITGVQLSLNMSKTISGMQSIALHRLLSDWGEGSSNAGGEEGGGATAAAGDATWIHRFSQSTLWDNAGGDFSAAVSASLSVGSTGIYTWGTTATMVSDVQMWLNMPSTNFGWILTGPDTSASAKRFNSREHPTVSSRPVLTVDYDLPVTVKNLIYPHVASNGTWETEIAVINTNDTQVAGKMVAYGNNGQKTGEEISIPWKEGEEDKLPSAMSFQIRIVSDMPYLNLVPMTSWGIRNFLSKGNIVPPYPQWTPSTQEIFSSVMSLPPISGGRV